MPRGTVDPIPNGLSLWPRTRFLQVTHMVVIRYLFTFLGSLFLPTTINCWTLQLQLLAWLMHQNRSCLGLLSNWHYREGGKTLTTCTATSTCTIHSLSQPVCIDKRLGYIYTRQPAANSQEPAMREEWPTFTGRGYRDSTSSWRIEKPVKRFIKDRGVL